jgi:hypothetical protein
MKRKQQSEYERFDSAMHSILSVSHKELQERIAEEKKGKAKKRKRPKS